MVTRQKYLKLIYRTVSRMSDQYVAGTHSLAFTTVPNIEVGKKIAHGAVEKRLVACANIVPSVISVYLWEGKVEEDQECYMFMKTTSEKIPELSKYIRENHPYDCPQVISTKIDDGNPEYLKWISETVSKIKI